MPHKYLRHHAAPEAGDFLARPLPHQYQYVLVIPAYRENPALLEHLQRRWIKRSE